MRRFSFALGRVLEIRAFFERRAEMALAQKSGACALIEFAIDENDKARASAAFERFRPGRPIEDSQAAELYIYRLEREREGLVRRLAAAQAEREKARLEYVERSKDKRLVDKLRDRRLDEYKKERAREETMFLDDVAAFSTIRTLASAKTLASAEKSDPERG